MTYLIVRHTVSDYDTWRPFFDQDESRRRANGGKGVSQVYRDVDNPNILTIVMEWDSAENAARFAQDPALADVMQKSGVVGMPAVAAIASKA